MKELLLGVFLLLLSACGSNTGQHLKVNLGTEPHSLDPRRARDLQSQTVTKVFFEGLTRLNPKEEVELALAEAIDVSEDGKTYIVTLRNALWSNGEAVTANDFVYAWKEVLHPNFPSDQAFQLYVIKNGKAAKEGKVSLEDVGIKLLDEKRIEITLENPTPYLLQLLAMPVFFPVNAKVDRAHSGWAQESKSFVCNGPFLLEEWRHSDAILVKKNPYYWDKEHVKLSGIEFVMVNEETELKMYQKKELDWAGSPLSTLPLNALPELKKNKLLYQKPFLGTYFFRVNTQKAPFDQVEVRRALALALNRAEIVEHVTQGGQEPATGLVPLAMCFEPTPYFKDGDRVGANEVLSRIDRATLPGITLLYISSERNHLITQAVQQQWAEALGIEVKLEGVERKIYYDRVSKKDFQLSAGSWTADYNDPMNFLEVFKYKTNGSNNTFWEDSRYGALLDQAEKTVSAHERSQLFQMAEKILIEQMPIIPLFHYTLLYLKNDRVQDVAVSALGSIDFKWAYLREETK